MTRRAIIVIVTLIRIVIVILIWIRVICARIDVTRSQADQRQRVQKYGKLVH